MNEPNEINPLHSVLMSLPAAQQTALIEDFGRRLVDAQSIPHIRPSDLNAYELPLLSKLVENIVLNRSTVWEPVSAAMTLPASVVAEPRSAADIEIVYHHALLALVVFDRFTTLLTRFLIQVC